MMPRGRPLTPYCTKCGEGTHGKHRSSLGPKRRERGFRRMGVYEPTPHYSRGHREACPPCHRQEVECLACGHTFYSVAAGAPCRSWKCEVVGCPEVSKVIPFNAEERRAQRMKRRRAPVMQGKAAKDG